MTSHCGYYENDHMTYAFTRKKGIWSLVVFHEYISWWLFNLKGHGFIFVEKHKGAHLDLQIMFADVNYLKLDIYDWQKFWRPIVSTC